ncbi:alpha/beta hydrolase [Streptomyces endophyticus]|uniref:Alpha/beta hydrolase n=1 Tax=Streptomyces endophyticus TaxID=714166 RepID=A0ABU6FJ88_9ACTN|nr:alpha/beta hydrolase [Streptomyces endophyticus]MEB8343320.1 alpha/beta hydrolase [Streptomyces endophyticus]
MTPARGRRPRPDVQALIDACTANFPALGTEFTDIRDVRAYFAERPAPPPPRLPALPQVTDLDADGVPVRVYDPPSGNENAPVVVFFHGGGMVLCSLDSHDGFCRELAATSGASVVSVDYRLAPEAPFPAAPEDAYTALLWAAKTYPDRPLVVAGDSAGGNLAAVAALLARERGGPALAAQHLYYPMLDPERSSASYEENAHGYFVTADHLRWYWKQYLTRPEDARDPRATPFAADRLDGLPPAFVVTAGLDPLRDEGRRYAELLAAAGVPTRYHCYDEAFHGFMSMGGDAALPEAKAARAAAFAHLANLTR